jgi:hypothetical protein
MYTWGYIKENTLNKLNMSEEEANQQDFLARFPYYANEAMTQICSSIKPKESFVDKIITSENVGKSFVMPVDFISFSDSPILWQRYDDEGFTEASDDVVECFGYNEVLCKYIGKYRIPYDARWFFFTNDTKDAEILSLPADICDALPSYIASQCMKLDDEVKAATYRNEYELFLSRINDNSTRRQKTFHIGGGW